MGFDDLSSELQEKLKACETKEELREIAKAVGLELSDEDLEASAGGTQSKDIEADVQICRNDCPIKGICPPLNK